MKIRSFILSCAIGTILHENRPNQAGILLHRMYSAFVIGYKLNNIIFCGGRVDSVTIVLCALNVCVIEKNMRGIINTSRTGLSDLNIVTSLQGRLYLLFLYVTKSYPQ